MMASAQLEIVNWHEATADETAAGRHRCCYPGSPGERLPLLIGRLGTFVGCAALINPSDCSSANCAGVNVHVLPEFRQSGFATQLVEALLTEARDLGYERIQARISAGNEASVGLFTKLGFVEVAREAAGICMEREP
jgi:RimJ/RimL family protein N-acetyltransferase